MGALYGFNRKELLVMPTKMLINLGGAIALAIGALSFSGVLDDSPTPATPPTQEEVFNIDGEQRNAIEKGKEELARRQAQSAALREDAINKTNASYDAVMDAHRNPPAYPAPKYSGRDNSRIVPRVESKIP